MKIIIEADAKESAAFLTAIGKETAQAIREAEEHIATLLLMTNSSPKTKDAKNIKEEVPSGGYFQ